MPKNIPQPVRSPAGEKPRHEEPAGKEPLSGSKKVKNRNHSRQNHGDSM